MKNVSFGREVNVLPRKIQDAILDRVRSLPMRDRLAVFLHYYQGLCEHTVAEILELSQRDVHDRLGVVLNRLRSQLAEKNVYLSPTGLARHMAETPEPEVPASLVRKIERLVQYETLAFPVVHERMSGNESKHIC